MMIPSSYNRPKYGNRKITRDGITFDSAKEWRRWYELSILERSGAITGLERQVKYVLIPAQYAPDTMTARGKIKRGKLLERECSYVAAFLQDVKEKRVTARSARNRRPHAGRGGGVRFPHDHMTTKERKTMNGTVKTYNLNSPMTWEEFKSMPDDLKRDYIAGIRERFNNPPDTQVARMFRKGHPSVCSFFRELHIPSLSRKQVARYNKEAFAKWAGLEDGHDAGSVAEGDTPTEAAKGATMASTALDIIEDIREAPVFTQQSHQDGAYPYSGCLTFDGAADVALALAASILGHSDVHLKIEWDARPKTCVTAKEE